MCVTSASPLSQGATTTPRLSTSFFQQASTTAVVPTSDLSNMDPIVTDNATPTGITLDGFRAHITIQYQHSRDRLLTWQLIGVNSSAALLISDRLNRHDLAYNVTVSLSNHQPFRVIRFVNNVSLADISDFTSHLPQWYHAVTVDLVDPVREQVLATSRTWLLSTSSGMSRVPVRKDFSVL